jgi:hypothetical protein
MSGKQKVYTRLKVLYENNVNTFEKKTVVIPDELLRPCPTVPVFAETNARVRFCL